MSEQKKGYNLRSTGLGIKRFGGAVKPNLFSECISFAVSEPSAQ